MQIFDEMQFIAGINWIPVECVQNIKTDIFLCDKKNCRTYKMSTDVLRRNARKMCFTAKLCLNWSIVN